MVLMLFACHCAEANSNFSSSLLCNHNRPQSLCQVDCAMFAENYFNGRATAIKRCGLLRLSGGRVGLRKGLRLGSTSFPLSLHNNNHLAHRDRLL